MVWIQNAGFLKDIGHTNSKYEEIVSLPEWASYLIWLGTFLRKSQIKGSRILCISLLPVRTCCASICAFGAISNALTNPANELSWELFLECEEGLIVYLLHSDSKGKISQMEGELMQVLVRNGQKLRSIKVRSSRKDLRNLTLHIGESKFQDSNISFNPHFRSKLLNNLGPLTSFYKDSIEEFNENRLLIGYPECKIITTKAKWHRENDALFLGIGNEANGSCLPIEELLLIHFRKTLLFSPKFVDMGLIKTPLAILDGLDALRSYEHVNATNLLILLNQYEFNEEAQDIIAKFSSFCGSTMPESLNDIPDRCPDGTNTNFYLF